MTGIGIKDRLHGARLAAGFVYLRDAAFLLGFNEGTYRHAEKGIRNVAPGIIQQAGEVFGVSQSYLEGGTATSNREKLAERIATILSQVDVHHYESRDGYGSMLERLRKIRKAEAHDTTNAAAEAHGWNRTVYWQHETGGRGMTLDRLIAYCLSMGARPEFGILGTEPLGEVERLQWTERERVHSEPDLAPTSRP